MSRYVGLVVTILLLDFVMIHLIHCSDIHLGKTLLYYFLLRKWLIWLTVFTLLHCLLYYFKGSIFENFEIILKYYVCKTESL